MKLLNIVYAVLFPSILGQYTRSVDIQPHLLSELPTAIPSENKILDFYLEGMPDGYGDLTFALNAIAWIKFYSIIDGLDLQIRIVTERAQGMYTPHGTMNHTEFGAFAQKFYNGGLKEALKRMHSSAEKDEISLAKNTILPPATIFDAVPEIEILYNVSVKATHIINTAMAAFIDTERYIDWNVLQKLIVTGEYNHMPQFDAIIEKFQELNFTNIPKKDKRGTINSWKASMRYTGLALGYEDSTHPGMLTPLPASADNDRNIGYFPTELKKSGSKKVLFIYANDNMYMVLDWILSKLEGLESTDVVSIIKPGSRAGDNSAIDRMVSILNARVIARCNITSSAWVNAIIDMFYACSTKYPTVKLSGPGFLSNNEFNKIIADPALDDVLVTGDQSLASVLKHLPIGKTFAYEGRRHKRDLLRGLENTDEIKVLRKFAADPQSANSLNRASFITEFKKLDSIDAFGLELKLYCDLFGLRCESNVKPQSKPLAWSYANTKSLNHKTKAIEELSAATQDFICQEDPHSYECKNQYK